MKSAAQIDNKHKDILILGEISTHRLDYTTLTTETKYPINFLQSNKFFLSLNYNGSNSFLFLDATNIY